MRMKHPNDFHCSDCDVRFDRGKAFVEHMLKDHEKVVTVPEVNDDDINVPGHVMRFTKKSTAVRTLKKEQDEASTSMDSFTQSRPKECSICDLVFDSTREYRMHQRLHSNEGGTSFALPLIVPALPAPVIEKPIRVPTHECDVCGKMFLTNLARNAHKNFKHKSENSPPKKRKGEKLRYDVDCDICPFTSHRRDYVEHHVKAAHKTEFDCPFCYRILSNYNIYMFHVKDAHKRKESAQCKHVCEECGKGFRKEESLKLHKESKHGENYKTPERYCSPCGVIYKSDIGLSVHQLNFYHLQLAKFIELKKSGVEFDASDFSRMKIKSEPQEIKSAVQLDASDVNVDVEDEDEEDADPFTKMMESKLNEDEPPPEKRFKPSEPLDQTLSHSNGDDKLDYLAHLQCVDDSFKCGICGKVKKVRKHMLHHLKQHKEIPTYSCAQCNEKFVFKRKYEKHLEMHSNQEPQRLEMNVDEHPKYQEVPKDDSNEIKCQICDVSFKLKIMLNRHNSTWHGDENLDKMLSMDDQKSKKNESKQELVVIKLLKCKHCLEAFIKPTELMDHLRLKHASKSVEGPENMEDDEEDEGSESTSGQVDNGSGTFACDKCKLSFDQKKYLENHQTFFCINRRTDQVINEQ